MNRPRNLSIAGPAFALIVCCFAGKASAQTSGCTAVEGLSQSSPGGKWKATVFENYCEGPGNYVVRVASNADKALTADVFVGSDLGAPDRPAVAWIGQTLLRVTRKNPKGVTSMKKTFAGVQITFVFK